jgi:hypothetical protein
MTDEEKHTNVMVALAKINATLIEVVKPAIDQVYANKENIIILKINAKNNKDNKSRLISYVSIVISFIIATMLGIRHFFKS